jgi:hypothetical protein
MIAYQSLRTYRDLLEALQNASEEQLAMRIQCTDSHPVDEYVHKLKQVICIGTVDDLDLRYARSVNDNRRNGNEVVLFCDGNPFGEDGRTASTLKDTETASDSKSGKDFFDRLEPVYPEDHDDSRDWTGPAQKLADQIPRKRTEGALKDILKNRMRRGGD